MGMRTLLSVSAMLLAALATGCPGDDKDGTTDSGAAPAIDLDRDGFGEAVDCDDQSSGIYPGADERCNGLDDDCDGEIDEAGAVDGVPGYMDADGDGWGDDSASTVCPGTTGYISSGGDCDDSSASINPSATELCDGVDNDCDTITDEPGTPDGTEYYLDQDDDGYGHPILTGYACAEGDGYSSDNSDCDDQDPARNPSELERCNNGQDDDCDGVIDESDGAEAPTWYVDHDGDGYGVDDATLASCEQPDGYADNADDCDDDDASVSPGDREVGEDGVDNDCDGEIDESGWSGAGDEVLNGYFVAGLITDDWDCINYYDMVGYDITDETACDSCDLSLAAVSEFRAGGAEPYGYEDCSWSDFSYWSEVEEFTTYWSFNTRFERAYYQYGDEWVYWTYSYGSAADEYMQWVYFLESSGRYTYEAGIFFGYTSGTGGGGGGGGGGDDDVDTGWGGPDTAW